MKDKIRTLLVFMALGFIPGLFATSLSLAGEGVNVTVSIPPQKYFLQKIAGDRADVTVMVLPGASPATYEPSPQQMVKLSKSKFYFAVGVHSMPLWPPLFSLRSLSPGRCHLWSWAQCST